MKFASLTFFRSQVLSQILLIFDALQKNTAGFHSSAIYATIYI